MSEVHDPSAGIDVQCVRREDPLEFEVSIRDDSGQTRHRVTMAQSELGRLASGGSTAEEVIDAAFRFLLDREAKESILTRFDVSVISRYFSEFERELPNYLKRERDR